MGQLEILMPKMGESVAEATIIKWLKKEGDAIALDEPLLEIATDKVDSEIPSTAAGIVGKLLFKEGEVVQVGKVVALIDGDGAAKGANASTAGAAVNSGANSTAKAVASVSAGTSSTQASASVTANAAVSNAVATRFYSPLVKTIAKEEGISMAELESLKGSGAEGRVTKNDVLDFIKNRANGHGGAATTSATATTSAATFSAAPTGPIAPAAWVSGEDEVIEMDRMRKLIADHMVMSKKVAPHVTSFVEVDVTRIVKWREKIKTQLEKQGEKFTLTPIFIEAIVKAIKDFPMINVSVDGTKIIIHKSINIGMAAALPTGNLIVPVIKNAERLNLLGISRAVNDLTARARLNKLLPDEIKGGTYTMSNVGTFGNVMGTPIINQPQVAIMAIGAVRKKPVVVETPEGDTIAIRQMAFLSHSYDHRVVDGALGGSFVRRVADYLEQFDTNRTL